MRILVSLLLLAGVAAARPPAWALRAYEEDTAQMRPPAVELKSSPWKIGGSLGFTVASGEEQSLTLAFGFDIEKDWKPKRIKITYKLASMVEVTDGERTTEFYRFTERLT